uniref:Inner centromere protein ARK-binding domain-containing protein n=3 Tax=Myotis myotis TaxID=51298 RepID=A0A7J7Z537_MYOMY|nr:hypothetical protein mMyoMyo1_010674 [Myotis myotis]
MAAAQKTEVRRKQEEEARRLRGPQQEEEEQPRKKEEEDEQERLLKAAEARRLAEQREQEQRREQEWLQAERELQEREKALRLQKERLQRELEGKKKEKQQRLQEEQKKAKEAAAASKGPNTTMDVQSPACTSYQMTPQVPRAPRKINLDDYGMDLNSDDSTDDESHPRKPIPSWATGTQLSQAILHQYCHPPNLLELFGTIRQLHLEDIFRKSKPRYHKRTSSAVWNSPPLQGGRVPRSPTCSLKY